ncbi:hypothetical protein BROUX41_001362 [Berkeleyomyces rouxiae]|uniref:uncharacterized protein n=1 Tax=Berkeleyomyces rouxiae TaxID=2035830 RepID=UPI003B7BB9A0
MASSPEALLFYALWQDQNVREELFRLLHKSDICNIRLANSACCNVVTKRLFKRTQITFTANTFTKPSRIQALNRVGQHIEHLTFHFPHSKYTFLAPLIHPQTGQEVPFLYTPYTSILSRVTRPKYNDNELGEILMQQYPPLFHAATNVPSFIQAMKLIPKMRHLTISCPGQDPQERYRRDMVDYALISLRISLEKASLHRLHKLSLSSVHPGAFIYLRHTPGIGSSPSSARRWSQINNLRITVDSWDFNGPAPGVDHLKMICDYIRSFSPNLEKFKFGWSGRFTGPCPLVFSTTENDAFCNQGTNNPSPYASALECVAVRMPSLRYMELRNTKMSSTQLRGLARAHKQTVKEFDFDNVTLTDHGNWREAMQSPYLDEKEGECWEQGTGVGAVVLDSVPQSPSQAVQAASRRLMQATMGFSAGFNVTDGTEPAGSGSPAIPDPDDSASFISSWRNKKLLPLSPSLSKKSKHYNTTTATPMKENVDVFTDNTFGESTFHASCDVPRPLFQGGSFKRSQRSVEPPFFFPMTPPRTPGTPQTPILKARYSPISRSGSVKAVTFSPEFEPSTPTFDVSPVQRNYAQEAAHHRLAANPEIRDQALQQAREAVLQRMAREYNPVTPMQGMSPMVRTPEHGGLSEPRLLCRSTSNATTAASAASLAVGLMSPPGSPPFLLSDSASVAVRGGCTADVAMGRKFREALFGPNTISVVSDCGLVESQSALVPLMLSRT